MKNQTKKMCKLMVQSGLFFFFFLPMNPPSWWKQKMTSWWWCHHDNDVMIAATLHWLLRAMWHANHLMFREIGESDFTETTRDTFLWMKWSLSIVRTDSSYKLPVSKMKSMHAMNENADWLNKYHSWLISNQPLW